jgi:hypothetical protein
LAKFKLAKGDFEKFKKYINDPGFDTKYLDIKLDSKIELTGESYKRLAEAMSKPISQSKNYASYFKALFPPKKIFTK